MNSRKLLPVVQELAQFDENAIIEGLTDDVVMWRCKGVKGVFQCSLHDEKGGIWRSTKGYGISLAHALGWSNIQATTKRLRVNWSAELAHEGQDEE